MRFETPETICVVGGNERLNVLRESSSSKKNAGISGRDGRNKNSIQQQNVEYLDGLLVTIRESKAVSCVGTGDEKMRLDELTFLGGVCRR